MHAGTMVSTHFTTLVLIILCGIKLYAQKKTWDVELRYFWMTLICCFVLMIQDILETYTATMPELRFWRVMLSALGYILRPVAAVGLLLVVCPPEHRTWKIWIPAMINTGVNLTAFFSPIAFSFDQDYDFVRGPLGYVVFVVSFLYMIWILVLILRRFYEGKKAERWILLSCVLGALAASLVDAVWGGCHLNEAIMIGSIFMLFFLRTHDNYLDPLTLLRNRFAYYDDSENLSRNITAVASIDMNGLKKLNDTRGHGAGDTALAEIGRCLYEMNDRRTISYRVGGDEFVILFMDQDAETVEHTLNRIRENVSRAGYSISAGYSMKTPDQSLENTLHMSDRNMYEEKAQYYQKNGRDRRNRSDRGQTERRRDNGGEI